MNSGSVEADVADFWNDRKERNRFVFGMSVRPNGVPGIDPPRHRVARLEMTCRILIFDSLPPLTYSTNPSSILIYATRPDIGPLTNRS